jgi:hypothetical protein
MEQTMTLRNATMIAAAMMFWAPTADAQPPLPPGGPSRSVTLPLSEYNRLTDLARPPAPAAAPPVDAVLSSADLSVRVDDSTARGIFSLTGQVLREGFGRLTLLSGATLLEANTEGRPLPIRVNGTAHEAWLPGPGPFAATLEWGAPLMHKPGRASFILPVPPAGAARATIDLPGDQADVRLSRGSVVRRTTANGRTIVEAAVDPGTATEVWWSMRDSAPIAAARESRIVADVMTLITIGDTDLRMVTLVDLTVLQGEPRTVDLRLPAGYQLTGITSSSLENRDATTEPIDGSVALTIVDPAARRHQFLVTLERAHHDGSFAIDTGLVAIGDAQRERGEVAIEGVGTLDLATSERAGMHRIDVREVNSVLQSVARMPLLSAFRYQRTASVQPGLDLTVSRFADAGVLAATVDYAIATTLVTSEGRALTEMALHVQNRAQPFLKVVLPSGASIVSVEVAGEAAKPVVGTNGSRVPLLRPGFRPAGEYDVSFVYVHAGIPFGRKGEIQMLLPRMDIPVGVLRWEVFAPSNYSMRYVDGNAITDRTMDRAFARDAAVARTSRVRATPERPANDEPSGRSLVVSLSPNEGSGVVHGVVTDTSGVVLPGVTILIAAGGSVRTATTDGKGTFRFAGVPRGFVTMTAELSGFTSVSGSFTAGDTARRVQIEMRVGALTETVTVSGAAPVVTAADAISEPPASVVNLQRRVAGVLPIRVDVPRAGRSYRFSRPLVVDDETRLEFQYKRN